MFALQENKIAMSKTKPPGQAYPLTPDQVACLTEFMSEQASSTWIRDYAMFRVMIDTMLRVSDVVNLTVGDVQHMHGLIRKRFTVRQKKTSGFVTCILSDKTREALSVYIKARNAVHPYSRLFPITPRWVQKRVKVWAGILGIDDEHISPHSLRRTKPAMVYKQTRDLRSAQIMLGHSSIGSTAEYLGIDREDAIEVFSKFEF